MRRVLASMTGAALASAIGIAAGCSDDDDSRAAVDDRDAAAMVDGDPRSDASADGSGNPDAPAACGAIVEPTVTTTVADARAISPAGFILDAGATPVIDFAYPDVGWTWNDPHVLRVGTQYWMYASATNAFDFPVRLYRLVSNDGITWQRDPLAPILEPGPAGTYEAGGVETPAVVFFQGRYHLFYTAYATEVDQPGHSVAEFRIGHATSCDGITWTRVSSTPLVAPSGGSDFASAIVGEPGPVVVGGQLFVYFTAIGPNAALGTALQTIGVVTSADGVTWTKPELVLEPDQSQYPRVVDAGPPKAGWPGYSTPNAVVLNGAVHLFFDVAYDPDEAHWQQVRLHHAVSPNGKTSWTQDAMPIARSSDYAWTKNEIRSPHALVDGNELRLWFAGHEIDGTEPNHFGIGVITHPLR